MKLVLAILFAAALAAPALADSQPDAEAKQRTVPVWIWPRSHAGAGETVYFRRTFDVEGEVTGAKLYASCDDEWIAFIDGHEVTRGDLWMTPSYKDVSKTLSGDHDGRHTIAIRGRNRSPGRAGLLVRLVLERDDGSPVTIVSDVTWRTSEREDEGWQQPQYDDRAWSAARVVGRIGDHPWESLDEGALAAAEFLRKPTATPTEEIKIAAGFRVELLYSPPKSIGSWVSMCVDPEGRLIVCDQYDGGLYRVTPPPLDGVPEATRLERIDIPLSGAQGLAWAAGSLYALVTKNGRYGSGLYRARDTDGDDRLDKVELLRALQGGGDHGWHGLTVDPDGRAIWVVAGNATLLPELARSRVPQVWSDDHLLPRLPDGRGFMVNVPPPGGCFYRVDLDGEEWELMSIGYRNPYDAAFHRDGDLFTFDADMEYDMNTPWYRPTRVNVVASGSDLGWRNGSGKWPPRYADGWPPAVDIGPGSPCGITFGYGASFPARFREALYLTDWSYGRIYAMHVAPDGSSYGGEAELFMSGAPLPTTDILVSPRDGAMYFVTGGWRIQTGLYRVTYVGDESTALAAVDERGRAARTLRRKLESLHGRRDPQIADKVWPHLDHADRFIRSAARVALEWQDSTAWRTRALADKNPRRALAALMALVRVSARDRSTESAPDVAALRAQVLAALDRIDWNVRSDLERLELLRDYALTFTRLGRPDDDECARIAARFEPLFPTRHRELNADLCELLVYLQAPGVASKAVALLAAAPSQEEQVEYAKSLRLLRVGWTQQLRETYFRWFARARGYRGGASFAGFVARIRKDALATLTDAERKALEPILAAETPAGSPLDAARSALAGRAVVKQWTVQDLESAVERARDATARDWNRGRRLFGATGCFACHRIAGEGGAVGPDLTGAGGRFSPRDLLETTVEPSKTVSDLYQQVVITTITGQVITGHIVYLGGDNVQVNSNMFDPASTTSIDRKRIVSMVVSPVSPMPDGLLDVLHEDEILDLFAYVLSGGQQSEE